MIEEFPFTTRVLQAEKDINSLRFFIAQTVRETKDRLALLTWARLTWEQRITLHPTIWISTIHTPTSKKAIYGWGKITVKCETLSQMQFAKDLNFGFLID